MNSKRIYAAWFGIHFLLITAVCFAGLMSLIAEGATILPSALNKYAGKAELVAASLLGKQGESHDAGGEDRDRQYRVRSKPRHASVGAADHSPGIHGGQRHA